MRRYVSPRLALFLATAVLAAAAFAPSPRAAGPQPQQTTRREFMRQKLEFSKLVLEGLTVENFDLIARNARNLKKLSTAAEWEVPTLPNAHEYVVFTGEFQRLCDDLIENSAKKNIDGATLSYLRLTMSCVNCHKYVRFAAK